MHKELHVYTDGGARGNPGPAAIGVVVCDKDDNVLVEHKEFLGKATNNVAEYTAMIRALEIAKDFTKGLVKCQSDSELMVKQLKGEYRVKAEHLVPLYNQIQDLIKSFEDVKFTHHKREHRMIAQADRLVNECLDVS